MKEIVQGGIRMVVRDFASTFFGAPGKYFSGGMNEEIEVEELECKAMKAAVSLEVS